MKKREFLPDAHFENYSRGYWMLGSETQIAGVGGSFTPGTCIFEVPSSNKAIRITKVSIRSILTQAGPLQYQANSVVCRINQVIDFIPVFASGSPAIAEIVFGQAHGPNVDLDIGVGLDNAQQFTIDVVTYEDSWSVLAVAGDVRTNTVQIYVEEDVTRFIGF